MGVVALVLACVFALFAPIVVHALVLGSWDDLRHFLDFGDLLGPELVLVYLIALVVIGVAGSLFARGRRVPPLLLHVAALMPLVWGLGGYVLRDRMRVAKLDAFGFGRGNVTDFAYAVIRAEAALDLAATMSAFAMMLVALAAALRHASRHDGARTLLVAAVSSGLCVATAVHAYSRRALFYALVVRGYREEQFTHAPHGVLVADTTRAVALALVIVTLALGVVMAWRIRAPAGKSSFALLVLATLSFGVPRAIARRDDALFRVPNPSAAPEGVHPPTSMFAWSSAPTNHDPRLVVTRDGSRLFDARDGKLAPMTDADFDHEVLGCIVDRDATFGALTRAVPEAVKRPFWLTFYVASAHPPDVSSEGTLAAFIVATNTTARVTFGDTGPFEGRSYVFIELGDLTLRIWHEGGPELVAPATNDAASAVARRGAFAIVSELRDYPVYIHARDGDTIARVWSLVDDIYAALRCEVDVRLTTRERFDYDAYERRRRSEYSF